MLLCIDALFTETIRRSHAYNYRHRETGLTLVLRGLIFFVAATQFRPNITSRISARKRPIRRRCKNSKPKPDIIIIAESDVGLRAQARH